MLSRRDFLYKAAISAAAFTLPAPLRACTDASSEAEMAETAAEIAVPADTLRALAHPPSPEDLARLDAWARAVREVGLDLPDTPLGRAAIQVGEEAVGTPYEPFTLEEYLRAGGSPFRTEPLTLSLTEFDCVSLVESCIAVARVASMEGDPAWDAFGREMERQRYRGGEREGYVSRLHYFSEWIDDNAARGLVREMGRELGGVANTRPLSFMSGHPDAYPALDYPEILEAIRKVEQRISGQPRWVIPTERISGISDQLRTGDIVAFATSIEGLDVTHAAFAYRDTEDVLRVLHAPLSGGVVEITESTLPEYVRAIRQSTGILVARPVWG